MYLASHRKLDQTVILRRLTFATASCFILLIRICYFNFLLVCCSFLILLCATFGIYMSTLYMEIRNVNEKLTFADVTGDAADLSVDHLLVELFDVERLDSEGQRSRQHGKGAHAAARTGKECDIKMQA